MIERIVATRPDGGVNVVVPGQGCFVACTGAGLPGRRSRAWRRRQVANFMKPGLDRRTGRPTPGLARDLAERWVAAVAFGGLTAGDYFSLLGQKDAGAGARAIELLTLFDLPADRWFRNAWRRSPDGGAIFADLSAARGCHLQNLDELVRRWNAAELRRDDAARLAGRSTNGPALIDWPPERRRLVAALAAAGDWQSIRAVWPAGLPPANAIRGLRFNHEAAAPDDGLDGLSSLTDFGLQDCGRNPQGLTDAAGRGRPS